MAATRIINEVEGVNRVVHDMTTKPPGGSRARYHPEATCPASPQPMASGSERHQGRPGGGPDERVIRAMRVPWRLPYVQQPSIRYYRLKIQESNPKR